MPVSAAVGARAAVTRGLVGSPSSARTPLLQRACDCGQHSNGEGECRDCKRRLLLQRCPTQRISGGLVSHPGDPFERDAERVANVVMQSTIVASSAAAGAERPRAGGSSDVVRRRPAANSSGAGKHLDTTLGLRLEGSGAPLDESTRRFMEPRFGRDFSNVRVHSGAHAGQLAKSVRALAFTVGDQIVFGERQYAPHTMTGRHLLAHELQHVVQQSDRMAPPGVFRLSAALCSRDCVAPDAAGYGPPSTGELTIAVDREQVGLGRLSTGNVGHTWVKLSDDAGNRFSYGFWPETGFMREKPFSSVKGCVHHPDTRHEPPRATEYKEVNYPLTMARYGRALGHAQRVCGAKPDYNLFSYNCTSFAIDVAKAAGVSPPSSTTLAIHNPNALYEGMEERREEGHPKLGALLGGLAGAATGAALGSLLGPVGMIAGGLIGGLAGLMGGALIGDIT
jgi:hypothetical protein